MTYYFAPDKHPLDEAEAEVFASFRNSVEAVDPDAIAEDGSIIGRNAATGELEPDAARTTGYYGEPQAAVQGFFHPVPEEESLQLADPAATGVEVTEHLNTWPTISLAGTPTPLPAWVQPVGSTDAYPLGMWVTHNGLDYESLLAANVWEPSPESNFWRVSPPLPPQPWKAPTGSADAYDVGDQVTHFVEGRDTDLWTSAIPANTTEPGTDGTFDRWWTPTYATPPEVTEWRQPLPGTANLPYEVDAVVTHSGKEWKNTTPLNVWEPGVYWESGFYGWEEITPVRARNEQGQFVADDPATPEDEAWA